MGAPAGKEDLKSYTSRRVRHCLGSLFWYRWQQVLLGLLNSAFAWEQGGVEASAVRTPHTLKCLGIDQWGRGRWCQFGDAALRECPKGQKDGRMQER